MGGAALNPNRCRAVQMGGWALGIFWYVVNLSLHQSDLHNPEQLEQLEQLEQSR